MKALKLGDVVAIKKRGKWWGEVTVCPVTWCTTYRVRVRDWGGSYVYGSHEYRREDLEPVGVNVR